jgi:HTH-type transcriptional regulator/antitoxin HigA
LLTLLIEDFEEKHYALPKASPTETIRFLMDQNGLKQKDLTDVFLEPRVSSLRC